MLVRRERERASTFARRKYCSLECTWFVEQEFEHPPCSVCGGEVVRGDGEARSRWKRRKTCSRECRVARGRRGAGRPGVGWLLSEEWLPCRAGVGGLDWFSEDGAEQKAAAAVCVAQCSRVAECAALAEDVGAVCGVWGGEVVSRLP